MNPRDNAPFIAKTSAKPVARAPRLLVKVAAWTLAVPALCVAVLVGGAAPLYLLLPDAKPAAEPSSVAASQDAPASPKPVTAAPPAMADAASPGRDTEETASRPVQAEEMPDEGGVDPPVDTAAATMVPTPRPAGPAPYTRPTSNDETLTVGSISPAPAPRDTPPAATGTKAPVEGRRTVVRTAAKLRATPQGAEIGVLREGAEIVVGRCDSWCEVSADGRRGFVHASLIDGTKRSATRDTASRRDARRMPDRFDEQPEPYGLRRYDRRQEVGERYDARRYDDRRFEERAYRRGVDPDWLQDDRDASQEEPDWYVEEEQPALLYDEPYPRYRRR